jgi:hypothetical protein
MAALDSEFLADVGLSDMPDDLRDRFFDHVLSTLRYRVADRLSESMADDEIYEARRLIDEGDQKACVAYLKQICPRYAEIVVEEFDNLKAEIRRVAATILEDACKGGQ